jgi:Dyp-type peroxidase family
MGKLQTEDIQGLILRTYRMTALRTFVLNVVQPDAARQFLGSLVSGDSASPQLATATAWTTKPSHCLNVGLTYTGLKAMGLSPESLSSFPEDFSEGAFARAGRIGDTGTSAPEHWEPHFAGDDVHVLVFLFADTDDVLEGVSTQLTRSFGSGLSLLGVHDAHNLPGDVAHFGYRDGFAQPSIEGGLPPLLPDVLPKAPSGEFLLGYLSQYTDFTYPVPQPPELGLNGSFMAFRILAQDCHGFEQFLDKAAAESGLDRELIAAKLCGRWRNGVPLALSPDSPDATTPLEKFNSFDYVPTETVPDAVDDRKGYRCPIGAHIRRMNPRNSTVAGNSGLKRRIIRRGLPYGPPYDPDHPDDGIERGLMGLFIGVSLKDQFEFIMSDWANKGTFAPGLGDTKDPVLGDNSGEATFRIPIKGQKTIVLTGLSRFVNTRGSAYCFLPSATAMRYLAGLPAHVTIPEATTAAAGAPGN